MNEPMAIEFLTLDDALELHEEMINAIGGAHGVKDANLLDSPLAQPQMTFGGEDFYPTLAEKAAALAFSLIQNHPFNDGNKRAGHAAMVLFLDINGYDFVGDLDEQERVILAVVGSTMSVRSSPRGLRRTSYRVKADKFIARPLPVS